MSGIDELRRRSFDRKAELYDSARPSYPEALIDEVIARSGLPRDGRILEIGAGTGKATVALACRGRRLTALEPGANMAAVLRRNVAAFANVDVVERTLEAWDCADGTFDLAVAAQALHWVAPDARYARTASALRKGGSLAVITNEKSELDPELRTRMDAAYTRWYPTAANGRARDTVAATERDWTDEIGRSGLFGAVHVGRFPWTESYTSRDYIDLLETYSDHAVLPDHHRLPLYEAITAAIERQDGRIVIPYVALVILACKADTKLVSEG